MSVTWAPKCTAIKIDMLSVTVPVSESDKALLEKTFHKNISEYYGKEMTGKTNYNINLKVYINGTSVLFQGWPKEPGSNWLRVEFNPSKIDPSEVAMILTGCHPGGYQDLVQYGSVTRIDFAIDVKKLRVGNLLFHYPGMSVSQNYLKAGGIQVAYLGTAESKTRFVFYDKVARIKSDNSKLGKLYKKEVPKVPTTRIEMRYRPEKPCTLSMLSTNTENKFEQLKLAAIMDLPTTPGSDFDSVLRTVIRASRYEGLQQALFDVQKHKRKLVRNTILQAMYSDWWKPVEVWKTLPAAMEPIINPKMTF